MTGSGCHVLLTVLVMTIMWCSHGSCDSTAPTQATGSTTSIITDEFSMTYRTVHLSSDQVLQCMNQSLFLQLHALSGAIHLNHSLTGRKKCRIRLLAPEGSVLRFKLPPTFYIRDLEITIVDAQPRPNVQWSHAWRVSQWERSNPPWAFSRSHNVTVVISHSFTPKFFTPVTISFISLPQQPGIQLRYTSNTSGYLESPLWDGQTAYATGLDSWAMLDIPAGFGMMASYTHFSFGTCAPNTTLAFYEGGRSDAHLKTLHTCTRQYHTTYFQTVYFRFQTGNINRNLDKGFTMNFTLHPISRMLQRAHKDLQLITDSFGEDDFYEKDNLWNCSVSFWEEFQSHFPCNNRWNCVHGEDEHSCPYTNLDSCGPGQMWLDGSCYKHVHKDFPYWKAAALDCLQRGGTLASLNTAEKWDSVMHYLNPGREDHVFFGIMSFPGYTSLMYEGLWQWEDGTTAFYTHTLRPGGARVESFYLKPFCAYLGWEGINRSRLQTWFTGCYKIGRSCHCNEGALCEFKRRNTSTSGDNRQIQLTPPAHLTFPVAHVTCAPAGTDANQTHVTHEFLACDVDSVCLVTSFQGSREACVRYMDPPPPSFLCHNEAQHVPYTLVCDHRGDCSDRSDEVFCVFPACQPHITWPCGDGQCIPREQVCDFMAQCVSGRDEEKCLKNKQHLYENFKATLPPPALVDMDSRGLLEVRSLETESRQSCPSTHFQCPMASSYCLPVYLRCNGVPDCPAREDEADCQRYVCPGYYRCRQSPICVHADHMCDGKYGQCPQNDDELMCGFTCPHACRCFGTAFYCNQSLAASDYLQLRYLHAERSNMTLMDLRNNTMLIYLSLTNCFLFSLQSPRLPNLRTLDLSHNFLSHLHADSIRQIENLTTLILASNPLDLDLSVSAITILTNLQVLDLSHVDIYQIDPSVFGKLLRLHTLNLSHSRVNYVHGDGFQKLKSLRVVDLLQCPVSQFPAGIFDSLTGLQSVSSSNYKLCCPAVLPAQFNPLWCQAPSDEVSSCEDLLQNNLFRLSFSLLPALSLLGNLAALLYWTVCHPHFQFFGCGAFLMHLCVSDSLKGVYMAVVGVADRVWHGKYMWEDVSWRHSAACTSAGVLYVWSLQVSTFLVCALTVDRVLVLHFPLAPLRFVARSAHIICTLAWVLGFVLAAIPLLPVTSHWQFYSHTAVCVPLPVTSNKNSDQYFHVADNHGGQFYYTRVFHNTNFALCLVVAVAQTLISWTVRLRLVVITDGREGTQELIVARRLLTLAICHCVCWFPVGVLGMLAARDVAVPADIKVSVAILVVPLNSALNPFLYTLNIILESRRKQQEQRLMDLLARQKAGKQHRSNRTVN